MNQQPKKNIYYIVLAVLFGLAVILFSLKGAGVIWGGDTADTNSVTWKDDLYVVPQNSAGTEAKTLGEVEQSDLGSIATTTTDLVSRSILMNYALSVKNTGQTTLSDAEAQALAQPLIKQILPAQEKKYGSKDLNISTDNSREAIDLYFKETTALAVAFISTRKTSDIEAVFKDPGTNPEERIAGINYITASYDKLIQGLLSTKTPSSISSMHLRLVQIYSDIEFSIKMMADVFSDPLVGLSGIGKYRKSIADLQILSKEYADYPLTE